MGFCFGILLISLSCFGGREGLRWVRLFFLCCCASSICLRTWRLFILFILLRHYCWKRLVRGLWRLSVLGTLLVAFFALSYGPFVYRGQGIDCSTLPCRCIKLSIACFLLAVDFAMPIGRAPSILVFYIILDKVLSFILGRLDSAFRHQQLHSLVC